MISIFSAKARAILAISLFPLFGCLGEPDEARGVQSIERRESASCKSWRLVVAGTVAQTFRHPDGVTLASGWDALGPTEALAASDSSLFAATEEGVVVAAPNQPPYLLLAHRARALAYDEAIDRLYVALAGSVVVRIEEPTSAAPSLLLAAYDEAEALALGAWGHLFVASLDDDGASVVRRYHPDGSYQATLTSDSWGHIQGITVGIDGSLYVVDGTSVVTLYDNPESLNGEVVPSRRIRLDSDEPRLMAILIAPDGTGYLSDANGCAIHAVDDLSDSYPFTPPSLSIPVAAGATALALVPPCF